MNLEKMLLAKKDEIQRPFGIFLSGGLDSGILAATLQPDFAITCNFKGKFYDELEYAQAIADHLHIPLSIVSPDGSDFESILGKVLGIIKKPINSVSAYPWYKIMEKAQDMGAKRMIGGEGSDETFGGYSRYLILQKIHELYQMESLQGYIPMLDSIFGSFVKVHSKLCGISEEVLEKRYKEREGKGIINQIGWAEFNESLEPIHQMEISLAKHFDIDLRLPFYDADVQQYGWSLTDENKIQGERRKVKVLEIAEKRLPRLVWRRKDKKGFVCPANKWSGSESDYDKTKYMELQTKLCEVKKDELANVKKDKTKVA